MKQKVFVGQEGQSVINLTIAMSRQFSFLTDMFYVTSLKKQQWPKEYRKRFFVSPFVLLKLVWFLWGMFIGAGQQLGHLILGDFIIFLFFSVTFKRRHLCSDILLKGYHKKLSVKLLMDWAYFTNLMWQILDNKSSKRILLSGVLLYLLPH